MWKSLVLLVVMPFLLSASHASPLDPSERVPRAAQLAVERDYLDWIHLPRWAGDCVDMPVVGVTWIEPEGVVGKRPVLWLRERGTGRFAAIVGLTESRVRSIGMSIPAEPVLILPDVSIYRLCRPWSAGY